MISISMPTKLHKTSFTLSKLSARKTTLLVTLLIVMLSVSLERQSPNLLLASALKEMPLGLASQLSWLYVLDIRQRFEEGQIIVMSLPDMVVARRIPTGFRPDFALSPDGSRLFVTSVEAPAANYTLVMIDTSTTEILDRQVVSDRLMYTIRPLQPTMVVSPNGRWLFVGKNHWTAADEQRNIPQKDEYALAVYDIQQRRLVKGDIPISSHCGAMSTIASRTDLYVICSEESQIYSFPFTPSGIGQRRVFTLPSNPRQVFDDSLTTVDTTRVHPHFAGVVFSPDATTMTVFTSYMRAVRFDLASGKMTNFEQVRNDRWAMPAGIIRSSDGSRIYIATGRLPPVDRAPGVDEILVLDAATLSEIDVIHTTGPFWSLTLSKDGENLFAVDPRSQTLYMIEASTRREVRKISGVGAAPSRVTVVPDFN